MSEAHKNKRSVGGFAMVVALMLAAALALHSMYQRVTGIWGHTDLGSSQASALVQSDRDVTVEFMTTSAKANPFIFYPAVNELSVHPGQVTRAYFYVENHSDQPQVFSGVAAVAPSNLARYLARVDDFSAKHITVPAGQTIKLPVDFFVDTKTPSGIKLLTLNYTYST